MQNDFVSGREQARFEVNDLARSVVALEHEENLCVQRLQHSRVVRITHLIHN